MLRTLVQSFSWGILLAIIVVIVEFCVALIANSFGFDALDTTTIQAIYFIAIFAFIEEFSKYLLIVKAIEPISYARDAIINAYFAGVGFVLIELIILWYKLGESIEIEALLKNAGLHILTFGFIGYRVILKKPKQIDFFVIGFMFLIHFLFNFSVWRFSSDNNIQSIIQLVIIAFLAMINLSSFMFVNKKLDSQ